MKFEFLGLGGKFSRNMCRDSVVEVDLPKIVGDIAGSYTGRLAIIPAQNGGGILANVFLLDCGLDGVQVSGVTVDHLSPKGRIVRNSSGELSFIGTAGYQAKQDGEGEWYLVMNERSETATRAARPFAEPTTLISAANQEETAYLRRAAAQSLLNFSVLVVEAFKAWINAPAGVRDAE